jgi:hypothetical protein
MKFEKPRRWVFDCMAFLEEDRRGVRLCPLKEKKSRKDTPWLLASQKITVKQHQTP